MKFFTRLRKTIFNFFVSAFFIGVVVTGLISLAAFDFYRENEQVGIHRVSPLNAYLSDIHQKTIDWRMRNRGPRPGDEHVAILAIDDRSLELEGRWPWSREKIGRLVDRALEDGAQSISFDMVFPEEDNSSAAPTLLRLKRTLAQQNKLQPEVDALITTELSTESGDEAFAKVIKKQGDHLILGAFSDPFDADQNHKTPLTDLCHDALFQRTYQSFYWRKEALPVTVVDPFEQKLGFPAEFRKMISDYVTQSEAAQTQQWFNQNPNKSTQLNAAFADMGNPLPEEAYPGLVTLWVNDIYDNTIDLLQSFKPELGNREAVQAIFAHFNSVFQKKEKAELAQIIRAVDLRYCANFMTDKDDLWKFENYAAVWGNDKTVQDNFNAISWEANWAELQKQHDELKKVTLAQARDQWMRGSLTNSMRSVGRWWTNIPLLGNPTQHSGSFDTAQDSDGTIRRTPIIERLGQAYMPSLAFKTFMLSQNLKPQLTIAKVERTGTAQIGGDAGAFGATGTKYLKTLDLLDDKDKKILQVPVDSNGNLMINYSGREGTFPYVSAADVLGDSKNVQISHQVYDPVSRSWKYKTEQVSKAEFMRGKILFLGATAKGVFDLRVVPFDENYPGVETHANILSNLLTEAARARGEKVASDIPGFLRTNPNEGRYMLITLIVLGLVLSLFISHLGSISGLAVAVIAGGLVYVVDNYYFFPRGVVITSIFPMAMVLGDFVTLTFYKYFTEERTKRELKGTFEKYVSPSIVAEVLADPSNIELGGKKMELTVLFSDVRGFTTISEKLDPRALSDLLNSYLTPMTNLVFANKGTLDKYMGDAIMAFWGAPIHFPDHAAHACRCALEMIAKLKVLQAEYRAKGFPEIDIGIGLNTGDMSVGNMGSDTVRSYTVMGDAVNLGSRLEGINKQYGTRIIISEFTRQAVAKAFTTREIDWVRVKGKLQPVKIFELISEGPPATDFAPVLEAFNRGFVFYHECRFKEAIEEFTQALNLRPDDAPSLLYLERCQEYLVEAPPTDWDGVFTMTSK